MKKNLCIIFSFVSAIVMAEETAYVKMTLTANSSAATYSVRITEDSENTDFFEDGADAELQTLAPANSNSVFIYAIAPTTDGGTKMCNSVYDNDVLGLPLGFKTNLAETEYTISFPNVEGRQLYLLDAALDSVSKISTEKTYVFTAEAGQKVVNDRFSIYKPSEPTICHQYGKLLITGHVGDKVKVLDMEGEEAIAEQTIDSDNKVIELSSLTSGEQYKVVLGEDTMIIRVQ